MNTFSNSFAVVVINNNILNISYETTQHQQHYHTNRHLAESTTHQTTSQIC